MPVHELVNAGEVDLVGEHGLTETAARKLVGAVEFGRRLATARPSRLPMSLSAVVAERYGPLLAPRRYEVFLAPVLDAKNHVVREFKVASGSVSSCPVSPRDIFRLLVREAASGVVFVHNHPSRDPKPSTEDVAPTALPAHAGETLGIRVLDHVIVVADGYSSLLDVGLMPEAGRWQKGAPFGERLLSFSAGGR